MITVSRMRWIWLGTTVSLAAALVLGSYLNYRGVANAAATLNRGQADMLEFAQRDAFKPTEVMTQAALDAFLVEHRVAGLRYFAIMDAEGNALLSTGEPAAPLSETGRPSEAEVRSHLLINVNGRMRSSFMRPPPRLEGTPTPDSKLPDIAPQSGPSKLYVTVMEFVPVAPGLVASAHRDLVIAYVGTALLALATFLFWRTSRRYDDARRRIEEQRRLTELGEMSAVLAHEIRNPLASLKGHAQLLTERLPDSSPERKKADRIVDEAIRLELLTNDLLDFARSGPMNKQPVNPGELLRACASEVGDGSVVVDTTGAPESWSLDERRFGYAVLANLLRNAVQASPPGKPAEARAFKADGQLVFTIRDHGDGLPESQEHRLFDPFFTTRTTGTGLGLALAKRIVELHSGRITAANAGDGGAIFRVELPATSH